MPFELTLTVVDSALLEPSAPPADFPVYFVFVKLYLSLQCRKTLEEVRRKSVTICKCTIKSICTFTYSFILSGTDNDSVFFK